MVLAMLLSTVVCRNHDLIQKEVIPHEVCCSSWFGPLKGGLHGKVELGREEDQKKRKGLNGGIVQFGYGVHEMYNRFRCSGCCLCSSR